MSDTLETKYYRTPEGTRYRVRIVADPDASSPRDADNVTTIRTFDKRYISPDGYDDLPEDYWDPYAFYGRYDMRRARKYAAISPNILAVRGLEREYNGTLVINDDRPDAGYIAITRQAWQRTWMGEADRKPAEALEEVMRQELDAYNRWASGEYVGYVVEEQVRWHAVAEGRPDSRKTYLSWEEVESCWGYDDQDYALKEALSWLPENVEEETD